MSEWNINNSKFSLKYYREILQKAVDCGYRSMSMSRYFKERPVEKKILIVRKDIDYRLGQLDKMTDIERSLGIISTNFIQVTCNGYNPFNFKNYPIIRQIHDSGMEIGLHSNFVEFAQINRLDPITVLETELDSMRCWFPVEGIACHRDMNYMYNSLPFLEKYWTVIEARCNLLYQSYDPIFMDTLHYVNESVDRHLCWNKTSPETYFNDGEPVCLMTHSHWWYDKHIHEMT